MKEVHTMVLLDLICGTSFQCLTTPAQMNKLVIKYVRKMMVLTIAILSASLSCFDAFSPRAFDQSFHILLCDKVDSLMALDYYDPDIFVNSLQFQRNILSYPSYLHHPYAPNEVETLNKETLDFYLYSSISIPSVRSFNLSKKSSSSGNVSTFPVKTSSAICIRYSRNSLG